MPVVDDERELLVEIAQQELGVAVELAEEVVVVTAPAGLPGPAGSTGPPGPAGPAGSTGPPGVPGDTVVAAASRVIANLLAGGDAQPAWRVLGDGKHEWGPGGSTAPDTNLYRAGASSLKTDGGLTVNGQLSLFNAAVASRGAGLFAYYTYQTGDSQPRWRIDVGGRQEWGPGGATVPDTFLYRSSAGLLKTDGGLTLGGNLWTTGGILYATRGVPAACIACYGTSEPSPRIQLVNSPRIDFGDGTNNTDVWITRPIAGTLQVQAQVATYTGTLTSGSPTVTGISSTTGIVAGMVVSGTGIAGNTTVLSVDSSSQITLSANASASGAQTLTIGRRTGFNVRGTAPHSTGSYLQSWQDFSGNPLLAVWQQGAGPTGLLRWRYGSQLYEQDSGAGDGTSRMLYQPNGDKFDVIDKAGTIFIASIAKGGIYFYDGVANVAPTNTALTIIGKNVGLRVNAQFGGGSGVLGIADAVTVPSSNPTGGGILYAEGGALKWRGSAGTVTVLGPA